MKKKNDHNKDGEKIEYVLCPRCELNYTPKKQRYCDVCLAALKADGDSLLLPEDDDIEEKLCPVCRVNYMNPDEEMCFMCQKERARNAVEEDDSWREYIGDDEDEPLDDLDISFEELAEEEKLDEEEEEFVGEDEEFEYVDPDEDYGDDEDDEDEDDDL